ncbi:MAG: glycosyltransferase family 39 protein [Nitrospirota bacterium]
MEGLKTRRPLIILSIIFIIKGILWTIAVPLWQSPDEFGHFGYIQYVGERGKLPILGKTMISKEVVSSFAYLDTARIMFNPDQKQRLQKNRYIGEFEDEIAGLKNVRREDSDILNYMAMHPPLYYFILSIIYRMFRSFDLISLAFLLRLFSIITGAVTVIISYHITKEIFPDESSSFLLLTPLIISFHPQFTFISSVISNDNLVILLFSLYILFIIRGIKNGISYSLSIILGIILGLGMLTKISFIIGFPIYILFLLLIYKITPSPCPLPLTLTLSPEGRGKGEGERVRVRGTNNARFIITNGMITLAVSFCLTAPLILFNLFHNGVLLLNNTTYLLSLGNTSVTRNILTTELFMKFAKKFFFYKMPDTYIGLFGNIDTRMPDIFYISFKFLLIASIIGVVYYLYICFYKKESEHPLNYSIWFLIIPVIGTIGMFFIIDLMFLLRYNFPSIQGRHLFIIIIPQVLLMIVGLIKIFPERYRPYPAYIFSIYFILMNIVSLLLSIITRYYYDNNPANFIELTYKISQYKPFWGRYYIFIPLFFLFCLSLTLFLFLYFRYFRMVQEKRNAQNS